MAKILNGNFYKGYADQISALDPDNKLVYGASGLIICRKCLEPYGKGVRVISVFSAEGKRKSSWHYQKCRCEREWGFMNNIIPVRWPGHDFNLSVEFCYCCGSRLINTGHQEDPLFCKECHELVRNHNKNRNNFQLPECRYSLNNPFFTNFNSESSERDSLGRKLKSYFKRLWLLYEWRQTILFEHLHESGIKFKNDIAIKYYDKILQDKKIDHKWIFERMLLFLYEKYLEIPNKEIQLVIR